MRYEEKHRSLGEQILTHFFAVLELSIIEVAYEPFNIGIYRLALWKRRLIIAASKLLHDGICDNLQEDWVMFVPRSYLASLHIVSLILWRCSL